MLRKILGLEPEVRYTEILYIHPETGAFVSVDSLPKGYPIPDVPDSRVREEKGLFGQWKQVSWERPISQERFTIPDTTTIRSILP